MKAKKKPFRIIYKELRDKPGIFRSAVKFVSERTGAVYVIELNENNMTYRIINVNKQEVIKSSQKDYAKDVSNRNVLRRQAKRALKQLGVVFDIEIKFLAENSRKALEDNRYVPGKKKS